VGNRAPEEEGVSVTQVCRVKKVFFLAHLPTQSRLIRGIIIKTCCLLVKRVTKLTI
jgi:hypothetical protein